VATPYLYLYSVVRVSVSVVRIQNICIICICILYGVATISRVLKIIGLFCRISSLLQGSFATETCNFKEPTNRSHPISVLSVSVFCSQNICFCILKSSHTCQDRVVVVSHTLELSWYSLIRELVGKRALGWEGGCAGVLIRDLSSCV